MEKILTQRQRNIEYLEILMMIIVGVIIYFALKSGI